MIENVSTQLTVFHCFAHCLLPGRAFASLYVLLFLEKEAEIGGRVIILIFNLDSQFSCYCHTLISNQPTSVAPKAGQHEGWLLYDWREALLCSIHAQSSNMNRKYFRYRPVPVSIRSRYGEPI